MPPAGRAKVHVEYPVPLTIALVFFSIPRLVAAPRVVALSSRVSPHAGADYAIVSGTDRSGPTSWRRTVPGARPGVLAACCELDRIRCTGTGSA